MQWLKHWSSKNASLKAPAFAVPMSFHRYIWILIQSTVVRWESWRKPWPGAQLCRLSLSLCSTLPWGTPPFWSPPSHLVPEGGWAGLSPPIPPAPHKAHTNNYSCLIVSTQRTVHKPRRSTFPQFVLKALQSKGWCRNESNQSNSGTRTTGQVCSLPPDWCTPPAPGNQAPHSQAKQGQALQSRSEETWACETWKGTTAAGGWWKEENKALSLRHTIPQTDSLGNRAKMFNSWKKTPQKSLWNLWRYRI